MCFWVFRVYLQAWDRHKSPVGTRNGRSLGMAVRCPKCPEFLGVLEMAIPVATQTFFMFTPTLGKMNPFWLIFFQLGWSHQLAVGSHVFLRKIQMEKIDGSFCWVVKPSGSFPFPNLHRWFSRSFGDGNRSSRLRCRLVSFHPQFSRWLMPRKNRQFLSLTDISTELRNKRVDFIEGRFESVGLLTKQNVNNKQKGGGVVMTYFSYVYLGD